jgi:transposase
MERVTKHRQLSGAERERLLARVARLYAQGASIRAIADATGRGYGTVQRMLHEAGVEPRSRGGAHRAGG